MSDVLEEGRAAYEARAWQLAFDRYAAAGLAGELDADGWDRLAEAAYLAGHDRETTAAWERAHRAHLAAADRDRAAQSAFWLGLWFLLAGDGVLAAGWLARASTILDEAGIDCAARGYLLVPRSMEALQVEDVARAESLADEAARIGQRFGDRDLWALGCLARGEARVARGDVTGGMGLLDELMVAVTIGELSPIPTGIVYCAVIEACMHGHDLERAAQWTEALSRWCEQQPDLVPYRGQCLVHRAQVFHARGEWERAVSEASGADRLLADPPHPARALARYVLGDLHRLRGTFDAAEDAYRQAGALGYQPIPGLPLLRLAQGRLDDALGGIRRALEEINDPRARPAVLAAAVEILVANGEVTAAASAAAELGSLADDRSPAVLQAMAAHAQGTAALAADDTGTALRSLRRACTLWNEVDMPYEAARARTSIAAICRALGDHDGADAELDTARAVFARLGAAPDLARTAALVRGAGDLPISAREQDVLALVAGGRTNREIGVALGISEHTVARHVQNIFTKMGVSSRAAAVASAFEHHLL